MALLMKNASAFFAVMLAAAVLFSAIIIADARAAQTIGCCEKIMDGAYCQNSYNTESECDTDYEIARNQVCEQTYFCKPGCCYSLTGDNAGVCGENAPYKRCADEGGTWSENIYCQLPEGQCDKGCCVLGKNGNFVTEIRCLKLAEKHDVEPDWHPEITDEQSCFDLGNAEDEGCCVTKTSGSTIPVCKFQTRAECRNNEFNKGLLCSNLDLGCVVKRLDHTACYDDDVYWFDNKGNRENIWMGTDGIESWNNGEVRKDDQICPDTSNGNQNSNTCGNCNYLLGSRCGPTTDNTMPFKCNDVNCYNIYQNTTYGRLDASGNYSKRNGEAWCVYDAAVNDTTEGIDPVGSEYWLHICMNGTEQLEECKPFRQEICKGSISNITVVGTNLNYTNARCYPNRWRECSLKTDPQSCENISAGGIEDCYWYDGYAPRCMPRYPPGFEFWKTADASTTLGVTPDAYCGINISTYCTETQVKKYRVNLLGDTDFHWECTEGCDCTRQARTQNLMQKCYSAGDCGAYINYIGNRTEGGFIRTGGMWATGDVREEGSGMRWTWNDIITPYWSTINTSTKVTDWMYTPPA